MMIKKQRFQVKCNKCKDTREVGYAMYRLIYPVGFSNKKNKIRGDKCLKCANKKITSTSFKQGLIPWNKGKGTKTKEVEKIRHTKAYRDWRKAVFERDDYTCQICFKRGGVLNADHIKPFTHHKELRFSLENGRTLCIECHRKTDTYGYKSVIKNKYYGQP